MLTPFAKYQGCGNDFILIDNTMGWFTDKHAVPLLCNRQKGIGADGVLFLEHSSLADYRMRIYNSDGSEAEMCGNGIRCLFRFIQEKDPKTKECVIETASGLVAVSEKGNGVHCVLPTPKNLLWQTPLQIQGTPFVVDYLDTGVPHVVLFVKGLEDFDVKKYGAEIRKHPCFLPRGTNVNFSELGANQILSVRTYERGVERETLACGTGAVAAALAASQRASLTSPIAVKTSSGEHLHIDFIWEGTNPKKVGMLGPATRTFTGTIHLD